LSRLDVPVKPAKYFRKVDPVVDSSISCVKLSIIMRNPPSFLNRAKRRVLLLPFLLGLMLASPTSSLRAESKPNILLIYVDDLGWKDLSCMGSDYYETPRIDALATGGMLFSDAYAAAPVCSPSRASLLTGCYTPRHGVLSVWISNPEPVKLQKLIPPINTKTLAPRFITMAEILREAGYRTAQIGKWHLGNDEMGPTAQGFDVAIAGSSAGMPKTYFSPYALPKLSDGPEGEYLTDRETNEAIQFIEKSREHPWFLFMSYHAVHNLAEGKLEAKPEFEKKFQGKKGAGRQNNPTYAAMIASLDENVGRLMDALDRLGLAQNTLVVFTSDNGGWGPATDASPLRGQKGEIYEGGIRVPLIARWPGHVKAGTRISSPLHQVDLLPTFIEVSGATPPKENEQPMDGESLLPILTGKTEAFKREALHWHFPVYVKRWDDNKTITGPFVTGPVAAIRVGNWKLIEFFEDERFELYDLSKDPGESRNLAAEMPDKTREMQRLMNAWRKDVNAPLPARPDVIPSKAISQETISAEAIPPR
jgi:arylsulfatase A-like enzyme